MRTSKEAIGETVRSLRKILSMRSDELAEKAELSVQSISEIEAGKRYFQIDTLMKLCKGLDTEPNVILGFEAYSPVEHIAKQLEGFSERELEMIQVLIIQLRKTYHENGTASVQ